MRGALLLLRFPVFLSVVLGIVLVASPGRSRLALHVYVLLLAAFALGRLLSALRAAVPRRRRSAFDAALRRRGHSFQRIPELERMEREVALGIATAFDLHYRLRPRLRRIAAALLAARRGIELDAQPDAARRALGDEAWELVRDDREPPRERFGPGIELDMLRTVVTSLEAL
jgi:hypothetical protein